MVFLHLDDDNRLSLGAQVSHQFDPTFSETAQHDMIALASKHQLFHPLSEDLGQAQDHGREGNESRQKMDTVARLVQFSV